MKDIDEAIRHCEEVVKEKENEGKLLCLSGAASIGMGYLNCAEEHKQLAEWLKELKRHREAWQKVKNEIGYINMDIYTDEVQEIIDKALGEVTK